MDFFARDEDANQAGDVFDRFVIFARETKFPPAAAS